MLLPGQSSYVSPPLAGCASSSALPKKARSRLKLFGSLVDQQAGRRKNECRKLQACRQRGSRGRERQSRTALGAASRVGYKSGSCTCTSEKPLDPKDGVTQVWQSGWVQSRHASHLQGLLSNVVTLFPAAQLGKFESCPPGTNACFNSFGDSKVCCLGQCGTIGLVGELAYCPADPGAQVPEVYPSRLFLDLCSLKVDQVQ